MATPPADLQTIIHHLASSSKTTRDRAIRSLISYLPSLDPSSSTLLKQIWKGLFYCIWHSDKPLPQSQLITTLADASLDFPVHLAVKWFEVFVLTIRREWSGIDYLRLDKYYLLLRKFLGGMFGVCKGGRWRVELVEKVVVGLLGEGCLLSGDGFKANGVSYHLVEVFLEELKGFLPVNIEVFDILVTPFMKVLAKSEDKVLVNKVKVYLFGALVKYGNAYLEGKKNGDEGETEMEVEVLVYGAAALKLGFAEKLFKLGSSEACVQANRKVIYGLQKEFVKLEKSLASSGIEVAVPEINEDVNMEEVNKVVAVEKGGGGSENKMLSKKKKKNKKKQKLSKEEKAFRVEVMAVEGGEVASMDLVTDSVPVSGMDDKVDEVEVANESVEKSSKKKTKKVKKPSGKSKGKDVTIVSTTLELKGEGAGNGVIENAEGGLANNEDCTIDDSVIANLQMQFEKVAAEIGMDINGGSSLDSPVTLQNGDIPKKRKWAKTSNGKKDSVSVGVEECSNAGKTAGTSGKKVKFQIKSNLVWKPHTPLPPQSLRVPPSATPRGSALKKGVPAGPVREMPKKIKRSGSVKKVHKIVTPTVKRLKKSRPASV